MRTNASLRIRVANSLITWGPVAASSVNDNDLSDGSLWRLAAGLREGSVEAPSRVRVSGARLVLVGS